MDKYTNKILKIHKKTIDKYTNTMRQLDHGQGQKISSPPVAFKEKWTNTQIEFNKYTNKI